MSEGFFDWVALFFGATPERFPINPQFVDADGREHHFAAHYQRYIRPQCETCEERRVSHLTSLQFRLRIAVLMTMAMIVFMLASFHYHWLRLSGVGSDDSMKLIAALIAILFYWAYQPLKDYKNEVKDNIFPNIFSFYGEKFQYQKTGAISLPSLMHSCIVPKYDEYDEDKSEDYVSGEYKGVGLELQELKLIRKDDGEFMKRQKSEWVVYHGLLVSMQMNKSFRGKTVLLDDKGFLLNMFKNSLSNSHEEMQKVALEDPEFEAQFEVYATDQIEARYLLTTSFMQRLKALKDIIEAKKLECSFFDNKLLLMFKLPRKTDRFAVSSIFLPATFEEEARTILAEMEQIFAMIEHLKLYEQTRL